MVFLSQPGTLKKYDELFKHRHEGDLTSDIGSGPAGSLVLPNSHQLRMKGCLSETESRPRSRAGEGQSLIINPAPRLLNTASPVVKGTGATMGSTCVCAGSGCFQGQRSMRKDTNKALNHGTTTSLTL